MLQIFLEKQLALQTNDENYRKAYLTFLISIVILTGALFFAFYNTFVIYYLPLIIIDSCAAIISLLCLYLLLIKRKINIAAGLLVAMTSIASYVYIYDIGHEEYAISFAFIVPVLAVFMLGKTLGTITAALYLILLLTLCLTNIGVWQPIPFGVPSILNIAVIYIVLFFIVYYFEASRKQAYTLLIQINDRLALQASTDYLTGLFNRSYIEDRLIAAPDGACFAMADVDNFKHINDKFGHIAGDEVLQNVALIVQDCLGKHGIVGRWGGEEFAILLDLEHDFLSVIENMRIAVANHDFNLAGKVSLSVGCTLHEAGQHKTTLKRVDDALYQAKDAGKNCIKVVL